MTNKEKKEYINILVEYNLRQACCQYRSQLNAFEDYILNVHLAALKIRYLLQKGWFSYKRFTKNDWSKCCL